MTEYKIVIPHNPGVIPNKSFVIPNAVRDLL